MLSGDLLSLLIELLTFLKKLKAELIIGTFFNVELDDDLEIPLLGDVGLDSRLAADGNEMIELLENTLDVFDLLFSTFRDGDLDELCWEEYGEPQYKLE